MDLSVVGKKARLQGPCGAPIARPSSTGPEIWHWWQGRRAHGLRARPDAVSVRRNRLRSASCSSGELIRFCEHLDYDSTRLGTRCKRLARVERAGDIAAGDAIHLVIRKVLCCA